jgi:4-amino-4-deoxy-L-arabinose transferase-like glycosyltransferase
MDVRVASALGLIASVFLFAGLGRYGIVSMDEGIYHAIAERMVETGDWLSLDFRGERRVYDTFMNAPLHYWARASLIAVFGSNGYTMRALSALFGVLTVLATYGLGCRLVGRGAALLGAVVLLTSFQFLYLHGARTGELDTLVTFLAVAACWAFLRGVEENKSFVPHHLALVVLGMTKLPLVILPIAAELVWLACHPSERRHLRRFVTTGMWMLPVALLWHGGHAWLEHDDAEEVFIAMMGQASGDRDSMGRPTAGPALGPLSNARFYARALLYGSLPWAAAYPFAIAAAFARTPGAAGRRTVLVFAGIALLFFVFVSKHFSWYLMPAYPFLSILVGAWLADGMRPDAPVWAGLGAGAVAAACLWLSVGALDTNPFDKSAFLPVPGVQRWLGLGPWIAIPLAGMGWAVAWQASAKRITARSRRGLWIAFAAALFVYASVRVATPLAYLDHRSPLYEIRDRIDRSQASGRPLAYPIHLGNPPVKIARYLFGEDFEIVRSAGGGQWVLERKGNAKLLHRSFGRAGFEWREQKPRAGPDTRTTESSE